MTTYDCTAIYFANASTTVDAESAEQAAELAQDKLYPTLCHQCADELDFDGSNPDGFRISEAGSDKELLDTTTLTAAHKRVAQLEEDIRNMRADLVKASIQRNAFMGLVSEAVSMGSLDADIKDRMREALKENE